MKPHAGDVYNARKSASPATVLARSEYAQEAGRVGLWDWNIATGDTWWSPVLYDLLGLPRRDGEEMLDTFISRVHLDDRGDLNAAISRTISQNVDFTHEFRIVRPDGSERWVIGRGKVVHDRRDSDAPGGAVHVLGVTLDITDRKLAEQQLSELNATVEARAEQLAQERDQLWALSHDFLVHAHYDGTIIRVSPSVIAVLGTTPRWISDLIDADNHPLTQDELRRARHEREAVTITAPMPTARAQSLTIAWSIAPDPEGECFIAVGRDVTDSVAAQARIRETETRLGQMQRMETLGQLASGVAHDFNNLLVPILSVLDLLDRRPQDDPDFAELITGANQAALKSRALVRRILAFAQRQQIAPERTDVALLLRNMMGLLRNSVPPAIELEIVCDDDHVPVLVHPDQLELSVLNFVINARDAMPDGGRITISARQCVEDCAMIDICVSDTGTGMDKTTIMRATEPFYTTKPQGKGTGLGLFMATRLADQAGGQLTIESMVGKGTSVHLRLPRMID